MIDRAARAAGAIFRRVTALASDRWPPGAAADLAETFDALQRDAAARAGWRGLIACWLREGASLVALLFRTPRKVTPMGFIAHDLRDARRALFRAPAYSLLVVATLALGIGVNTAIFSVVDALLFKALPYADPDRLVRLTEIHPSGNRNTVAPANFLDWQRLTRSFSVMAARQNTSFALLDGGEPIELIGARVSVGYFDMVGTQAALGRTFQPADGELTSPCVAVISHRLWAQRFAKDVAVVGKPLHFSGFTCDVVGVLPEASVFDRVLSDIYTPLVYTPAEVTRLSHFLGVTARLAPGVSVDQARAEMKALAARINTDNKEVLRGWGATADPLRDLMVRADSKRLVWVLFGAVGLVLLVGCVNIAGLALSRTIARQREVAVRVALGAGRWRVFRALVIESLLLAGSGAVLGLLVGRIALNAFASYVPAGTLPAETLASLDGRALLFTAVLAILTGLLFGTMPAWQGARSGVNEALRAGGRGATGTRLSARLHSLLLVAEVALAMVLVAGAALLVVSFLRLTRVDPGFQPQGVITLRLPLPQARYREEPAWPQFYIDTLTRIRQIPGVLHATAVTSLPLNGWLFGQQFRVEGSPSEKVWNSAHIQHVSGDYVATLGMPLKEGRAIAETDTAASPGVVMINETFARRFIGEQSVVGRSIIIGGATETRLQIVGVMRDVKTGGLGDAALATPEMYVSQQQFPIPRLVLAIKTQDDEAATRVLPEVRAAIHAVDPQLPVGTTALMSELIGTSLTLQRFQTAIVSAFALLAGLLACVGVYAVRSQAVHARQREVGIRMALGATPRDVLAMTVGQGLKLVGLGLALGLAAAMLLARAIEPWLFNTRVADPAMLAGATVALGTAGLLASWIPARRAARLDPVRTLRAE